MADAPRPPPLRRKPKAPVRHRAREQTPEEVKGHARVRAAKICSSSMYVAIVGVVLSVLPFAPPGGGILAGAAAVVVGVWGFIALAKLGKPPRDLANATPIERVGARMAARAKGQAGTGIAVGLLLVMIFFFLLWRAAQERQRREDRVNKFLEQFQPPPSTPKGEGG